MSEDADAQKKKLLVAKRGGHKAYATKLMNEAKLLCESGENRGKLNAYLKSLNERKDVIAALDDEILGLLTVDEFETEIVASGDYQTSINVVIFSITDALENIDFGDKKPLSEMPPLDDDDDDIRSKASETSSEGKDSFSKSNRAKLPKLQLKPFSGERLLFQEFWECFESAVDNDPDLDKIMKFTYLRSLLEGDAAAVISGLSLTSSNYDEALKLLRDRYANKQVLIFSHIDQLLNLPTVTSSTDTSRLRDLYDQIEKNVRCLKNLDISSIHYGPILLQIIMKKIPDDIQLIVSRSMSATSTDPDDDTWQIDELLKAFKCEIESREMCSFVGSSSSDVGYSASSLFTGVKKSTEKYNTGGSSPSPAQVCVFCEKGHASWKCRTITDVATRKKKLLRKGRCYVCLMKSHVSRNCPTDYKCVKCSGRHNVSLCDSKHKPDEKNEKEKKDEGDGVHSTVQHSEDTLPT